MSQPITLMTWQEILRNETNRRHGQNRLDDLMLGRRPVSPVVLFDPQWTRHDNAARLFFNALIDRHAEAAAAGRLEHWKAAAHSAVELFGSEPHGIKVWKRSEIEGPAVAGPASGEVLDADRGQSESREPLTDDNLPIFDRVNKLTWAA